MIRINLLPEAKRQVSTGGSSQLWGVVYLLAFFAWGVVLFLVYLRQNNMLAEQQAKNRELQAQIEQAQSQSDNLGELEKALAKSKQLEEVVGELQAARQGPARLMLELSRILSEGGGPTISAAKLEELKRTNPLAAFNTGWDIRRLWLKSFTEKDGKCTIAGFGKTNEDIAEFLRRLSASEIFKDVQLRSTSATSDGESALPVVSFSVSCEVKY